MLANARMVVGYRIGASPSLLAGETSGETEYVSLPQPAGGRELVKRAAAGRECELAKTRRSAVAATGER